jgi:hypothetical protein
MSIGDFFKSSLGFGDDVSKMSFEKILRNMDKVDPLGKDPKGDGLRCVEHYMEKLKLETKSKDVLKKAQEDADWFIINIHDRKVRGNQINDLKIAAAVFEPSLRKSIQPTRNPLG